MCLKSGYTRPNIGRIKSDPVVCSAGYTVVKLPGPAGGLGMIEQTQAQKRRAIAGTSMLLDQDADAQIREVQRMLQASWDRLARDLDAEACLRDTSRGWEPARA